MDRRNSQASASQETLISLQQLEPSPIESPLELDKQLPNLPIPARTNTLGLSGSGHGAVYYLTRLQRYSSYVFTIYTTFHIANTSLIPLLTRSVPDAETYLLLTRPYYQSSLLEPLLITLPVLIHIGAGLALRVRRRDEALRRYGASNLSISSRLSSHVHIWPRLSYAAISGYILTPLVLGHAFVNRVLPWWVEGSSSGVGLGFVSHGFAKHPFVAWTGYGALITVATGHIVWGWARWLGFVPEMVPLKERNKRWWSINGVVALVTSLWAAGGLGVVGRGGMATGWIAKGWDELYAKIPLLDL